MSLSEFKRKTGLGLISLSNGKANIDEYWLASHIATEFIDDIYTEDVEILMPVEIRRDEYNLNYDLFVKAKIYLDKGRSHVEVIEACILKDDGNHYQYSGDLSSLDETVEYYINKQIF
jgi:hypothetical protein